MARRKKKELESEMSESHLEFETMDSQTDSHEVSKPSETSKTTLSKFDKFKN